MTPARVLLLADESAISARVGRLLVEKLGHHVGVASSIDDAAALLGAHAFDVVLVALDVTTEGGRANARRLTASSSPHCVAIDGPANLDLGVEESLRRPLGRDARAAVLERAERAHEAIDDKVFGRLRSLTKDREELRALVRDQIEGARELIAELRGSAATSDTTTLHRAAHSLKGTSAMFGALRLSRLAAGIEARSTDPEIAQRFDALESEAARAAEALIAAVDR